MTTAAQATGPRSSDALHVEVFARSDASDTLAMDVQRGLAARPYRLPPKHFYDDAGSRLFDQICDTPEYYPTRAEAALLARVAPSLACTVGVVDLVELGSGAARKTRILLEALLARQSTARYVPVDINEAMLRRSSQELLAAYPGLRVHGVVGDYEQHLSRAPADAQRLVAFLGSTIGNFEPEASVAFLAAIARQLRPGDHLLLGVDLDKDPAVLTRAYNDAAGLTAAFNKNVLAVLNRRLAADFSLDAFDHVAFYDVARAQIEMHLRARFDHVATVRALELRVPLLQGETIHTEISRKFTRENTMEMLRRAGFTPREWYGGGAELVGLALAAVAPLV